MKYCIFLLSLLHLRFSFKIYNNIKRGFLFNIKESIDDDFYNSFYSKQQKQSKTKNHYNDDELDDFYNSFFPRPQQQEQDNDKDDDEEPQIQRRRRLNSNVKSENFEIITEHGMNFSRIGGYDLIKMELLQCADLLLNYEKYKKYNVRTPKGLIMEGLPGNGKTLMAKCFAGEIDVNFIPVSGSQFQEKFVGVGPARVRELFKLAKTYKPCIIFIDEIDALGRKRSDDVKPDAERDTTLNELLVCLDGFVESEGIFIIGATNRIDLLDPALIRPGRVDKKIYMGLPNEQARLSIITIHIHGKPHDNTVNIPLLVEQTDGLSGAQIESLLNEAMLYALRSQREEFTMSDIEYILNRMVTGWQSVSYNFSKKTLYRIAIHELGHAIVGHLLKNHNKVMKVVINPQSPKTPGYTQFETDDNDVIQTRDQLLDRSCVLLGGFVAEKLFFADTSTGASQDLEHCRHYLQSMILTFGMGDIPLYSYFSETSKTIVDREISNLFNISYKKTCTIIKKYKKVIRACTKKLLKKNILTRDDINAIFETFD